MVEGHVRGAVRGLEGGRVCEGGRGWMGLWGDAMRGWMVEGPVKGGGGGVGVGG